MTRRAVAVLAGISVVLTALAIAAALRQIIPQLTLADFSFGGDQVAIDAYYEWLNSGWVYYSQVPWLSTAALLTAVAALTLAAYAAQRRLEDQAGSASATASRETARS